MESRGSCTSVSPGTCWESKDGMRAWSLLEMWDVTGMSREGNGAGGAQPEKKEAQEGFSSSPQLPDRR